MKPSGWKLRARLIACLAGTVPVVASQAAPVLAQTPEQRAAVAAAVEARFDEIAEATNALDLERLSSLYRDSEDLTYVARGVVTRSHAAMRVMIENQFGRVASANLRWLEKHVDVLGEDVAVVTARYDFRATLDSGDPVGSAGTFTCIYVLREGRWQIQHSSHTFPQ